MDILTIKEIEEKLYQHGAEYTGLDSPYKEGTSYEDWRSECAKLRKLCLLSPQDVFLMHNTEFEEVRIKQGSNEGVRVTFSIFSNKTGEKIGELYAKYLGSSWTVHNAILSIQTAAETKRNELIELRKEYA